jgi:SAM-dependent methyltransferase
MTIEDTVAPARAARLVIGVALALIAASAAAQHGHATGPSHAVEMNAKWAGSDVDVAQWVQRFEDPARDVIANRERVVAALRLRQGQAIADVGAGTGAYLSALSKAVGPTGRVIAIDISPAFVAHMAARARVDGLANVSARLGTAAGTGLADASQDVILSVNTFHHFADPAVMLADMRRALKPGGQLAIVDFDRDSPKATDHQREMAPMDMAAHVRMIEAAGFRLVEDVQGTGLTQNFLLRFERTER